MIKHAIAIAALAASGQAALAAAVIHSTTGLESPVAVVGFDEQALAAGDPVTDEFAPQGVTFSPYLRYTPDTGYPNVAGADVGDFAPGGGPELGSVVLGFPGRRLGAAFALVANGSSFVFEALRGGVVLDSFTADVGDSAADDFFGFTGFAFDAIRLTSLDGDYFLLDSLQLGALPEPGSLGLAALALAGAGACGRRRR